MGEHEITRLLDRWSEGDREALDELMPLVYLELKRIAAAYLGGERPSATLQVTALVHEAYLRLVEYREPKFESRKHFYAVAAQAIRRILVEHARRRNAVKRDSAAMPQDSGVVIQPNVDVLALDAALNSLGASDPEKAQIAVQGAEDLYREIRIDNELQDRDGEKVKLKPGAEVEVTIEAPVDAVQKKTG